MGKRIAALIFIYLGCSLAWVVLGGSVVFRTEVSDREIKEKVTLLWGKEHRQRAPTAAYPYKTTRLEKYVEAGVEKERTVEVDAEMPVPLERSDVRVSFQYEPRRKGLFWYSTYAVSFAGEYAFRNATAERRFFRVRFFFPSAEAGYDNFRLTGGKKDISYENEAGAVLFGAYLEPNETYAFGVSYDSRGLDTWRYTFDETSAYADERGGDHVSISGRVNEVKGFSLVMTTNFDAVDFPVGSMSPSAKRQTAAGQEITWRFGKLITGLHIGLAMPSKLNPGPLAGRITFFAPVSLLFFFFVLFVITVMRKVELHPMHYFFLGAAFFAFHLLFAYLVDHVDVHAAFAVAAATSIFLVVTYMRAVVGWRFALVETGLLQLLYLVAFSYTHFFEGWTGLIITILAVATLFAVMQITARVNWNEAFAKKGAAPSAP